jgi:5-methyltetrahydropteroyltriglutamate--homocysteine methyltransferase
MNRILTTDTGSLGRPRRLASLLIDRARGKPVAERTFSRLADAAVDDAVRLQLEAGVDIISNGEMDRADFIAGGTSRLTNFNGPPNPFRPADLRDAPGMAKSLSRAARQLVAPSNTGPISYNPAPLREELERFGMILERRRVDISRAFHPSPSPGSLAMQGSSHYQESDFVNALADAMAPEYHRIHEAGLQLQLDCPDVAMAFHVWQPDQPRSQIRDAVRLRIAALNRAISGIPRNRVRLHMCWGNYLGPHHRDAPLAEVIDLLYQANVGTLVLEHSNPQHRHEWRVFTENPLPAAMTLAVGVVDPHTVTVEHQETVADILTRLAPIVGKNRLMASTDCGFGTYALGVTSPAGEVAEQKLAAMTNGARLASEQLWGPLAGSPLAAVGSPAP